MPFHPWPRVPYLPARRRALMTILMMTVFSPAVRADGVLHTLLPSGRFSLATAASALTPPMGWNPWNAFRTEVTEDKIMAVARSLKNTGLADAGYRYVNIDDGWWLKRRADGRIEIRTSMFPSAALADGQTSFRPFVERLHGMGLKAGIYTDIGRNACSQAWDARSPNLPAGTRAEREVGSFGHQAEDMRLIFGEWGFDFIKVDACGLADFDPDKTYVRDGQYRALGPYIVRHQSAQSEERKVEALYADLRKAIAAARPDGDYLLSICTWGEASVADWAKAYGSQWRTSPDISANWNSMLRNFDSAAGRALYAGPGRWNDPDMLEVGIGQFDASHLVEARAHMSLWAIIGAPLILGSDLTRMPQSVLDILGNREVIAINQDPAGNQGVIVAKTGDTEIIVKTLAQPGTKALALVNRGGKPHTLSVPLARLNLDASATASVRDLWTGQTPALDKGSITVELAPHETTLLLVKGRSDLRDGVWLGEMPARINVAVDGRATLARTLAASWVPAQVNAAPSGQPLLVDGKRHDNGLGVLANSRLEVRLDGGFRRFLASAGRIADAREDAARPKLNYRVYGDGKLLFDKTSAQAEGIDVPVRGVKTLELVVRGDAGPATPVTAAWADARLTR
jgi:alpha-galactosidase